MSGTGFADPLLVKVTSGVLVTWQVTKAKEQGIHLLKCLTDGFSDSAAKQILLHVDSGREGSNKFILRDGESADTKEPVVICLCLC